MKTLLKSLALLVVSVIVLAAAALTIKLDSILRAGIVDYGPRVTQTTVEVAGIHVSPLMGSASIKGLAVGNPKGFSSSKAFTADVIRAKLRPRSLLTDTIVVDLVEVDGAKVSLEGKGAGSNLSKIEANANAFAADMQKKLGGGQAQPAKPSKSKNVVIKRLVLRGAQATVRYGLISGDALSVALPDIELRDIDTAHKSSVVAELVSRVTRAVQDQVVKTAAQPLKDIGNQVKDIGKGIKSQFGGLFHRKD